MIESVIAFKNMNSYVSDTLIDFTKCKENYPNSVGACWALGTLTHLKDPPQ